MRTTTLYYLIVFVAVYLAVTQLMSIVIKQKTARTKKSLRYIKKLYNRKEKVPLDTVIAVRIVDPLIDLIKNKVKNFSLQELERKLLKAGITKSPSQFIANSLAISISIIITGYLLGMVLDSLMIKMLFMLLGPLAFVASLVDINQKIKKKNDIILQELPQFEKTILYQFKDNKPLIDAIRSYLPAASQEFRLELSGLISDIEIYDDKTALEKFSERLAIAEVSNFCYTLISGYQQGIDINQIVTNQEMEIRRLNRDNIRKKLKRLPVTMNAVLIIPIACMLLIYTIPSIVYTFTRIKF